MHLAAIGFHQFGNAGRVGLIDLPSFDEFFSVRKFALRVAQSRLEEFNPNRCSDKVGGEKAEHLG